jgi:hypothetical protein
MQRRSSRRCILCVSKHSPFRSRQHDVCDTAARCTARGHRPRKCIWPPWRRIRTHLLRVRHSRLARSTRTAVRMGAHVMTRIDVLDAHAKSERKRRFLHTAPIPHTTIIHGSCADVNPYEYDCLCIHFNHFCKKYG